MFSKDIINKFREQETPFYYYDLDLLRKTLDEVKKHGIDNGFHIHYALKSNFDDAVLRVIKEYGLGIDAVSGNEIQKAIDVGFNGSQIAFAGVGKSDAEINLALDHDIFAFNCESPHELQIINELAVAKGKTAQVALRINPNVDPKTHKYITTGLSDNKFGINPWDLKDIFQKLPEYQNVNVMGAHFHIGSQITDIGRYQLLCDKLKDLLQLFDDQGIKLTHVNVGGGLGIDYENPLDNPIPPFKEYFETFKNNVQLKEGQELHFELGRSITGQCGTLITKVLYLKPASKTNFAIVDGGMTELIRPMLYQAHHEIKNLTSTGENKTYDVVGPICESTDSFAKGLTLPECKRGDLIAIRSAGAYGQVMSSRYNLRDLARAVNSDELQ